jgi:signal transduction histidine kinase
LFFVFTTAQAEKKNDIPKIYFSGLKIFNKEVLPNDDFDVLKEHISRIDTLTLSYIHAVVNFEYNAISFRHPEKVQYAYYMEGFETEWNNVGNTTSATYTNLNAGDYTLRIKSTNSDGVWVDNETELHIIVTPPFWETWWFRLLVLIVIALTLYLGYRYKVRNIKQNQLELERQIAERTKELQQQKNKLVEASKELSLKNDEIQQFTYAVSHDLKSPLNNIKGIASVIPLDFKIEEHPNLKKCLEVITISCNTMSELISDITEISRLGTIENKNELLDTNEILNLSGDLISAKLSEHNISLNIAENLPKIYGDRNRMIQVFGNLMDNAVKYMGDQKKPRITVNATEEGEMVHFSISDNGSGMDKAALDKLFTPFMRFHAKVKGTGLGLFMSKKIAISHGGTLSATSEGKGKGATFTLSMPKAKIAPELSKT